MKQINKYSVTSLGTESTNVLSTLDRDLVDSYDIANILFLPEKYTVNINYYDLNNNFTGTVQDSSNYTLSNGTVDGTGAIQISVDPVQDALNQGYKGDVILEYEVFNNLFSPNKLGDSTSILYITDISADRTEIRTRSTYMSDKVLKYYADGVYGKLNNDQYFSEIYLDFIDLDRTLCTGVNIYTEVLDGTFYVLFKLYEPLPTDVRVKSRFTVVERIGSPVRFRVDRSVEVIEETEVPVLKGPNFNIDCSTISNGTTDYLNYNELLSYPLSSSYYQLYSTYGDDSAAISIDHEDFSSFIHFSSAAERLENFRYKLGLLKTYSRAIDELSEINPLDPNIKKYDNLIEGMLSNFDHYEKFLYFDTSSKAWPKENLEIRPYVNYDPNDPAIEEWWENILSEAQSYDEHNVDLLINSIPAAIREDENNEPYVIFVHMIGQHFDDEWIYAKAVAEKYNADNRLNFGVSKDLVKEALSDLGVNLYETNQNLNDLFQRCNYNGTYNIGDETSVRTLKRISVSSSIIVGKTYDGEYSTVELPYGTEIDGEYANWLTSASLVVEGGTAPNEELGPLGEQPLYLDDYRKEVYKRVYHNVPLLLKTKGTSRGLRALLNCFGIPDDILTIKVRGSNKLDTSSFFGPEEATSSSLSRIHLDNTGSMTPLYIGSDEESFILTSSAVFENIPAVEVQSHNVPGTHEVEVGFNLNEQYNRYAKSKLNLFDYDNIVGDPRNLSQENYGESFIDLQNLILSSIISDGTSFRSPSAIIRLVRYIDSMLLRSLQDFIAAHDTVSRGVLVEDNLLHRNRYAGNSIVFTVEGIDGVFAEKILISGSSGGSFDSVPAYVSNNGVRSISTSSIDVTVGSTTHKIVSNSPNTNYYDRVVTPEEPLLKPVFGDQPEYTGELSGSVLEVFQEKEELKKVTVAPLYKVHLQFLNLPRPGQSSEPKISTFPSSLTVGSNGGTGTVNVDSNTGWTIRT